MSFQLKHLQHNSFKQILIYSIDPEGLGQLQSMEATTDDVYANIDLQKYFINHTAQNNSGNAAGDNFYPSVYHTGDDNSADRPQQQTTAAANGKVRPNGHVAHHGSSSSASDDTGYSPGLCEDDPNYEALNFERPTARRQQVGVSASETGGSSTLGRQPEQTAVEEPSLEEVQLRPKPQKYKQQQQQQQPRAKSLHNFFHLLSSQLTTGSSPRTKPKDDGGGGGSKTTMTLNRMSADVMLSANGGGGAQKQSAAMTSAKRHDLVNRSNSDSGTASIASLQTGDVLGGLFVPAGSSGSRNNDADSGCPDDLSVDDTRPTYIAMYSYEADEGSYNDVDVEEIMTVEAHEVLYSTGEDQGRWIKCCKKNSGEVGWLPKEIVREAIAPSSILTQKKYNTVHGLTQKSLKHRPSILPSAQDKNNMDFDEDFDTDDELDGPDELYLAIHPYSALHEGDLPLLVGDVIRVHDMTDNGWWQGTLEDGRCGYFPGSYVSPMPSYMIDGLACKGRSAFSSQPDLRNMCNSSLSIAVDNSSTCDSEDKRLARKKNKAKSANKPNRVSQFFATLPKRISANSDKKTSTPKSAARPTVPSEWTVGDQRGAEKQVTTDVQQTLASEAVKSRRMRGGVEDGGANCSLRSSTATLEGDVDDGATLPTTGVRAAAVESAKKNGDKPKRGQVKGRTEGRSSAEVCGADAVYGNAMEVQFATARHVADVSTAAGGQVEDSKRKSDPSCGQKFKRGKMNGSKPVAAAAAHGESNSMSSCTHLIKATIEYFPTPADSSTLSSPAAVAATDAVRGNQQKIDLLAEMKQKRGKAAQEQQRVSGDAGVSEASDAEQHTAVAASVENTTRCEVTRQLNGTVENGGHSDPHVEFNSSVSSNSWKSNTSTSGGRNVTSRAVCVNTSRQESVKKLYARITARRRSIDQGDGSQPPSDPTPSNGVTSSNSSRVDIDNSSEMVAQADVDASPSTPSINGCVKPPVPPKPSSLQRRNSHESQTSGSSTSETVPAKNHDTSTATSTPTGGGHFKQAPIQKPPRRRLRQNGNLRIDPAECPTSSHATEKPLTPKPMLGSVGSTTVTPESLKHDRPKPLTPKPIIQPTDFQQLTKRKTKSCVNDDGLQLEVKQNGIRERETADRSWQTISMPELSTCALQWSAEV